MKTKFITSRSVHERGSSFAVKCAKATSINDVRALYKAVLLDPAIASASHAIAAYRLNSRDGTVTDEDFNDDGDFGMGRKALDAIQNLQMKNVVVFVVRLFGGTHLGPKRVQIVEKLVKESLKALESD